jgi:DNA modification methylase
MNKLILGDNLEIMRKMESETVDLIYLDPPFFSNRNYEVLWGDEGEIRSFQDRWSGGIEHYIAWLKERVIEMHRILKQSGSIYLHCDWHADAYIRVHILDRIFGDKNFRNAITWKRSSTRSSISKIYRRVQDTILFYSKTENYSFNQQFMILSNASQNLYKNIDEKGIYQTVPLLVSGKRNGLTGSIWKGIDPNKQGKEGMHWVTIPEKLDEYDKQGLVYWPERGKTPRLKYYLEQSPGVPACDIWDDIKLVQGKESIGYPTQKPEKLLERIITASSNENEIVFDPFVGGGTTIAVAEKLNRKWIGIDQSVQAIKVTEFRLVSDRNLFSQPFIVQLHKYDYDTLFNRNAFEFETWIIDQFGGIGNTKQKSDFGIDGKTRENIPIQVKQTENIGRNVVDNFSSAIKRYDKALYEKNIQENKIAGYIIAFSFGKGAVQEVARLKNDENVLIKLMRVDEIVPISVKPILTVEINDNGETEKHLREIEFIAKGETTSEKHIEFYAWDFNYNDKQFCAEILRDTIGKQTKIFKPGEYKIAAKVIDNEGLENTEIIKLKVNGKIEKY